VILKGEPVTISEEHRREVERALAGAAPPLWQQLAIKAEAVKVARRALNLEGAELRRSLIAERELLALSLKLERGEDIDWPTDIEYRTTGVRRRRSRRRSATRPIEVRIAGEPDLNQLYGNWAVYDDPTEIIDPHDGAFTEVLRHGAAADAISQKRRPPYLRDHGRHPQFGKTPVARITYLGESSGGAWVEAEPLAGQLYREQLVEPARAGVLGHSFAFSVPNPEGEVWRRTPGGLPVREVLSMRVFEISAVASPAYSNTSLNYRDAADPSLVHPEPRRPLRKWNAEAEARRRYLWLLENGIK
jgi:phage head maturation protease